MEIDKLVVGSKVIRTKFPTKWLVMGQTYIVTAVGEDEDYNSGMKIALEGTEPTPQGKQKWFDPDYFILIPEWEVGGKVVCVVAHDENEAAVEIGQTYTIKQLIPQYNEKYFFVVESAYLMKRANFILAALAQPVPLAQPRVVIYNKQSF